MSTFFLLVPPVFYGTYCGELDDGSNNMKKWFYNHLMTKSLRENANEPLIEFHIPVFSENDLKNYLNTFNLESMGVELTKMDYWWTVPGNSFDEVLEQQWNPDNTTFTSWPGVPMENVFGDVYKVEVPKGVSMIIFNNKNGTQTQDIPVEGMNKIYYNNQWNNI